MPALSAAARCCLCLLTLALTTPILAAEDDERTEFRGRAEFHGLAEEMSAAEFFRTGLDELTPEQLAALDEWLRTRFATAGAGRATSDVEAEADDAEDESEGERSATPVAAAATTSAAVANATAAAEAEAAARLAEEEAAAAIAAAEAAEAEARERAAAARARQEAAEKAALEDAERARRLAEQEARIDEPFQDGRWVGPKPDRVEARIQGAFDGWRGETLFSLDNGQVWKQRQRGSYFHSAESPEIVITRNMLGFFVLEVASTGKKIGVTRVR